MADDSKLCQLSGGLHSWQTLKSPNENNEISTKTLETVKEDYNLISKSADSHSSQLSSTGGKRPTSKVPSTPIGSVDVLSDHYPLPIPSSLSLEEKYIRALSVAEQCIQPEELRALFERKEHPICYDGFEPSGRMHIAQGILKAINVNKLTSCGCVFVFWVADWFALLNNKMGGDLRKIQRIGEYFVEVWKASGMDMRNVRFLWASEEINRDPSGYWLRVMSIAKSNTISRIKRCSQIMGRSEGDDQPAAQILYPCMQCSDIFFLKADICQLGMDQRKVNMLAREYCDEIKQKHKPVVLSHPMMPGLLEGQDKMSKSMPDTAIFMEDSTEEVNRKIKKAYCPPQQIEGNPCVAYVEMLVFPSFGEFDVERKERDGGRIVFKNTTEFRDAVLSGNLHPGDLKANLAKAINSMLEPVRKHLKEDPQAKALVAEIQKFKVER